MKRYAKMINRLSLAVMAASCFVFIWLKCVTLINYLASNVMVILIIVSVVLVECGVI